MGGGGRGLDVGRVEAEGVSPPQSALTRLTSPNKLRSPASHHHSPPAEQTQIAQNHPANQLTSPKVEKQQLRLPKIKNTKKQICLFTALLY